MMERLTSDPELGKDTRIQGYEDNRHVFHYWLHPYSDTLLSGEGEYTVMKYNVCVTNPLIINYLDFVCSRKHFFQQN